MHGKKNPVYSPSGLVIATTDQFVVVIQPGGMPVYIKNPPPKTYPPLVRWTTHDRNPKKI